MKTVQQTILSAPTSNSMAACVASLFEEPLWLVPNFGALRGPGTWWKRLTDFAMERGWRTIGIKSANMHVRRGDTGLATIKVETGFRCMLICLGSNTVIWDPMPEGYPEDHQLTPDQVQEVILFVALK